MSFEFVCEVLILTVVQSASNFGHQRLCMVHAALRPLSKRVCVCRDEGIGPSISPSTPTNYVGFGLLPVGIGGGADGLPLRSCFFGGGGGGGFL